MDTLKKFTITFGVNTKPLEQGIQKSESTLKKFAKTFNALAATYLSYKMFQGVINGFVDFNNKLSQSTQLMGYNTQNVAALGGALKRFGGDTDTAINSLNSLSKHLSDARMGGGALIDVARKYGVTFTNSNGSLMSAEGLLMSLSSQMQRYDKQTRATIASQLGLDETMQAAFMDGGKELRELIAQQKRFGVVTEHDMKISKKFQRALLDLKDSFNGIVKLFARFVLPALTKLLKLVTRFIEFLKKHKQLVIIFFTALLIAMLPVLAVFLKMAIASAAAFAPIYAVVAVVTAIALIIEDIYYYFMGWDSVTGDLAKKFPVLGKILEGIRPIVMGIAEVFEAIWEWIKDPSWDKFANIFKVAGENIKKFLLGAFEKLKEVLSYIWEQISKIFSSGVNKVLGWFGIGGADEPPVAKGGGGGNTTNNINNNVTQNISSATPQQLANDFNAIAINSVNNQTLQR